MERPRGLAGPACGVPAVPPTSPVPPCGWLNTVPNPCPGLPRPVTRRPAWQEELSRCEEVKDLEAGTLSGTLRVPSVITGDPVSRGEGALNGSEEQADIGVVWPPARGHWSPGSWKSGRELALPTP